MGKFIQNIVSERFVKVFECLKSKGIVSTNKEFADKIDYLPQSLGEILAGRRDVTIDVVRKLIIVYNINPDFIFIGTDNIFRTKTVTEDEKNAVPNAVPNAVVLDKIEENTEYSNLYKETKPERHLIPFYDIQAIAGRYSGADMTPVMASTEMIDAGDWFHDATAAMRIYGDSMTPDYKSGSIVALKEVYDKRIILYGDDYVIETNEIRVLKRLQRADERSCWLACSTNQEIWEQGPQKGKLVHEPFEIPVDMVRRLYLVIGEVNRKHGNIINFNER